MKMALRKIESLGWCVADMGTWMPTRWSFSNLNTSGTPGRRPGTYWLRPGQAAPTNGLGQTFDNQATWIIHAAVRLVPAAHGGIFAVLDGATPQISLWYNSGTQKFQVQRGWDTSLLSAIDSDPVVTGTWYHLIFKTTIHSSAGSWEVRLNGQVLATGTGQNSQTSGNNYANRVQLIGHDFHDIVICDGSGSAPHNDIMGDLRVNCAIANAAGAVTAWTPSTGSNYQNVDETTPDTDTTYNLTSTAGAIDTYATADPTLTGPCRGIAVAALCRKDDAGTRTVRPIYRDAGAGVNYPGTTRNLADSYVLQEDLWPVHPGTGVAFTPQQLSDAQVGVELIS